MWVETVGAVHPHVAAARHSMARALVGRGDFEAAAAEHRRALALREQTLGEDHVEVAQSRSDLAAVLLRTGGDAEAIELAERAWTRPQRPEGEGPRERHGCVTAWLVLMLVGNSAAIFMYLAMSDEVNRATPGMPEWALPVLMLVGAVNIVFTIMLFRWMKLGFYGCVATGIIAAGINASIGLGVQQIIMGLVGVAILYGVLQISANGRSAWQNLE